MKKSTYVIFVSLIIVWFLAGFAFAQKDESKVDPKLLLKVKKIVEDSKIPYNMVGSDVWVLYYNGKNKKDISVAVVPYETLVVYQALICEKNKLILNNDLYVKMADLSRRFDRGKFIITGDGDLIFRIDSYVRTLDLKDFADDADQAAAATDEAYPELQKFIKK